ncbi:MAG: energy transducer TonB [Calditrichaceae bacterium]
MQNLNLFSKIKFNLLFILVLITICTLFAQTRTIDGQTINQTVSWAGEIRITGDVVVAKTGILIIEQGTKIVFEPQKDSKKSGEDPTRCELVVKGVLLAKGTANNKIVFTSAAKSPRMGDWYGIQIASSRQGSEIEYAIVEYAYDGITIKKSSPQITNSHIRYNYNSGLTIEIKANPRLIANIISENGYAGIVCRLNANPYMSENMISLNQIGIIVFGKSQPNLGSLEEGSNYNIGQNTIINNVEYDFHNHSSQPIMAENNSWGTSNLNEIENQIYDSQDESKYGTVDFQPVLGSQRNAVNRILGNLYASNEPATNSSESTTKTQTPSEPIAQNTTTTTQRPAVNNNPDANLTTNNMNKDNQAVSQNKPFDEQSQRLEDTSQTNIANNSNQPDESSNTSANPADGETRLLASNTEKIVENTPVNEPEEKIEEPAEPEINYNQIFFDGFLDEKKEIVKQVAPVVSGSRRNIMHGQVYVRVIIDKKGRVENAKALRGIDEYYDKISEEAAKKFVFKPGKINDRTVKFQTMLLFKF